LNIKRAFLQNVYRGADQRSAPTDDQVSVLRLAVGT